MNDTTEKLNKADTVIGETLNTLYRVHCSKFDDPEMGENYTRLGYDELLNLADNAFGLLSDYAYDEEEI